MVHYLGGPLFKQFICWFIYISGSPYFHPMVFILTRITPCYCFRHQERLIVFPLCSSLLDTFLYNIIDFLLNKKICHVFIYLLQSNPIDIAFTGLPGLCDIKQIHFWQKFGMHFCNYDINVFYIGSISLVLAKAECVGIWFFLNFVFIEFLHCSFCIQV